MTTTIKIEDMTCGNCVAKVETGLGSIPGVNNVSVDLATGTATIDHNDTVTTDIINTTIEDLGFDIQ